MAWFSSTPMIADILSRFTPASGANIQIPAGVTLCIIDNATLLAVLTVTFPPNPIDGQRLIIAASAAITLMTCATTDGSAIKGPLASLVANAYARYSYVAAANAWFRTG